jgi:outer membrane protein OmpA-like peptidoglycan-associated protein
MKGRRSRLAWLLLSLFWIVAPRAALAYGDCPMVGTLEGFDASAEPQITHYDAREVAVADANGSRREIKKGEVCKQRYDMKEGAPPLSALEIMQNYAQGLPALGLKITNVDRADDGEIFAVGTNHGAEYWAHVWQDYGTSIKVETLTAAPFQSSLLPHAASACPIVPALAGFSADEAPKIVNYAAMEMHVVDGDEEKTIVKKGKLCKQRYDMKEGAPPLSALDILQNYAQGLPALGLKITNVKRAEDGEIYATMTKDGVETWAHVWQDYGTSIKVETLTAAPFQSSLLPHAASDCPIVPTLAGFSADEAPKIVNYATMEMHVVDGDEEKTIVKKGNVCKQRYDMKEGAPPLSALDILQNYAQGLPALGLKITNVKRAEDDEIYATMTKDGVETWAHVWQDYGTSIKVETLQIEPFKSSMKAPQPAAQTPAPPAKARLVATATRDGKPIAGAWCGAFAPGATGGEPIVRADSGKLLEIAPGAYDIGCFVAECGAKAEGWQRNQALAAGDASLGVDTPAPRVSVTLQLQAPSSAVEPVVAESGDFPYLPSVPGSTALGGKALAQPFYVQPADAKQPELVAEKSIEKDYRAPRCATPQAIGAGYADALQKSGWTIVNQTSDPDLRLAAHFGSNGRNIWASVSANASGYALTVADATVTGAKIAEDLNAKCHLALTGVLFDFAKSTLKPESDAILGKVAEALAADPALKLEVEGHTDNVGSDAYNDKLSLARAKSVVKWLEDHDVDGKRVKAHGYGKTRPIADNDSDEGRAKNRRVELANLACKKKD